MIVQLGLLAVTSLGWARFLEWREETGDSPANADEESPAKTEGDFTGSDRVGIAGVDQEHVDHYVVTSTAGVALAFVTRQLHAQLLSGALTTYNTLPALGRAFRSLRQGRIDNDVLVSSFYGVGLLTGHTFVIALSVFFYNISNKLLAKTQKQSRQYLSDSFEKVGTTAQRLVDGEAVEVDVDSLQPGDTVMVTAGEVISVDGRVVAGASLVDQNSLTGESRPAEKLAGEQVLASTVVLTGTLHIQVEKAARDTTVAKIEETLLQTADFKSTIQSRGEKWADQAALPILGLAGVSAPVLNTEGSLVVMNSGFGNRIRLYAPLGTLGFLTVALRNGILIKDGRAFEMANDVDMVVFDKTGTLTDDKPGVGRIFSSYRHQESEILAYAAAAEQRLGHPIARAILDEAETAGLTLPEVESARYDPGLGVTVQGGDDLIRVGSRRFMAAEGIATPTDLDRAVDEARARGSSPVFVALGGEMIGALEIQPHQRSEAPAIVERLRAAGVRHIAIISGDREEPTRHLAENLGADRYFHEVLPDEKARIVKGFRNQGHTICYVGDGINDAVAMKESQVSVSLRGASSIATDTANVILMDGTLQHLPDLLELSGDLDRNLSTSWGITFGTSVINLGGLLLLGLGITGSVLIKSGAMFVGLYNSLAPFRRRELDDHGLKPVAI